MKAYILNEDDFEILLKALDRDPNRGLKGGFSALLSDEERAVYEDAHRFYNYQIHTWIDRVKK
jgi:hypothetical protein